MGEPWKITLATEHSMAESWRQAKADNVTVGDVIRTQSGDLV
jgi:hypothetical protein